MSSVSLPAELMRRYRRLFSFYDRDGDGHHTLEGDFEPVAVRLARRWEGLPSRFRDLLGLLLDTYRHENERRDQNNDGMVDGEEFLVSHGRVFAAAYGHPTAGIAANLDRMLAELGLPPGRHLFDGLDLVTA